MAVTITGTIVKLSEAGDEYLMRVAKCEVVESPKFKNKDGTPQEQVKFQGTDGHQIFIARDTADKKLTRIGFADGEQVHYGEVDGSHLRFYKDANKNDAAKPYWGVDRAEETFSTDEPRATGSKRIAGPHDVRTPKVTPQNVAQVVRAALGEDAMEGPPVWGDEEDFLGPLRPADRELLEREFLEPEESAPVLSIADQKAAAIDAHYARAWRIAVEVQGEIATPESLHASASTMLIAYQKAGVC